MQALAGSQGVCEELAWVVWGGGIWAAAKGRAGRGREELAGGYGGGGRGEEGASGTLAAR